MTVCYYERGPVHLFEKFAHVVQDARDWPSRNFASVIGRERTLVNDESSWVVSHWSKSFHAVIGPLVSSKMCGSCDAQVAHRSADQFVEKSSESMRILRGDRKKRKSETLDEAAEAVPTLAKSKAGKSKSAKIATSSASSSKATSKKVTKKPAHGWADFRNGGRFGQTWMDRNTLANVPLSR